MNNQRNFYTFRESMTLPQIDKALEEMASSGWRMPETDELQEHLRCVDSSTLPEITWYWSNSIASESPYEGIREQVNPEDKDTRVVIKYHGREIDSAFLDRYGTIFFRDNYS